MRKIKPDAYKEYIKNYRHILRSIDRVKSGLQAHKFIMENDNTNWGIVGELDTLRDTLQEARKIIHEITK